MEYMIVFLHTCVRKSQPQTGQKTREPDPKHQPRAEARNHMPNQLTLSMASESGRGPRGAIRPAIGGVSKKGLASASTGSGGAEMEVVPLPLYAPVWDARARAARARKHYLVV